MGPQLPAKRLDLLEEVAEAEHGFIAEARDSLELELHVRGSLYNSRELELDIDAGHLSAPMDPAPDDQATRNSIRVRIPSGAFAVSVQEEGDLNVNDPEDDPDGVGEYPEDPELSFSNVADLQSAAHWRRALGTIKEPRYPGLTADLTAVAYQQSRSLTVETLAIDTGRMLRIANSEVSPDALAELVQAYTEKIDQYDWLLTWVATPGRVYQNIGIVGITTRVQPYKSATEASFISGTDTALSVERLDPPHGLWVRTADDPLVTGFDIMVSGVRLRVVSVSGTSDPQTITVEQTPVNGVVKTIPAGEPIRLAEPWRIAW